MRRVRGLSFALCLGALAPLAACSGTDTAQESGDAQSFNAPYDAVVVAAQKGLTVMNLDIAQVNPQVDRTEILFVRPGSMTQLSAVGRIVVDKSLYPPIKARIVYDRRSMLSSSSDQQRWTKEIFEQMSKVLAAK